MGAPPLNLRAIIFPDGREWVAHCLDLDLVETGATSEAAMDALAAAVNMQLWYARSHDNFEHLFQPSPPDVWRKFGAMVRGPHRTLVRALEDHPGQEFALQSLLAA